MTNVGRLLRVSLPVLTALTVATAAPLPAKARAVETGQPPGETAATVQAPAVTRASEWWLSALNVPAAWRAAPSRGRGVTVAVLSTGVDGSHPDLTGAVTTGPDFSGSGRRPGGPYWGAEGTAVASLVAGHGHGAGGADGITGVAPETRILSVRVTLEYDDPLNTDSAITRRLPGAIAAGIRYAVGHGATVIALPLDPATLGPAGYGDPAVTGGSAAERSAVRYALAHGVLLVAPAGDNGAGTDSVNYPAGYPGVIAVGATGRDGQLSPFTSTRSYVALTAPGSDGTPASVAAGLTAAAPGGGYQALSSTDMAAALAAGVAALIRSRYPWLTVPEVRQALERGAGRPPAARVAGGTGSGVPGWGHGALSAAAAVKAAAVIAAAHPRPAPRATATPRPRPRRTARAVSTRPAAAHRTDPGSLLRSLLVDLVIVAGALIAVLTMALAFARLRRGKRSARASLMARPGQDGGGGQARHTRIPLALPPAASSAVAPPLSAVWPPAQAQPAGNRVVPGNDITVWLSNSSSAQSASAGRPPRYAQEPPWPPAAPPGAAPLPPVPSAESQSALGPAEEPLPPWERQPEEFAVAPSAAEQPPWPVSTTGPMYVWNPGATTDPIPLYITEENESD